MLSHQERLHLGLGVRVCLGDLQLSGVVRLDLSREDGGLRGLLLGLLPLQQTRRGVSRVMLMLATLKRMAQSVSAE